MLVFNGFVPCFFYKILKLQNSSKFAILMNFGIVCMNLVDIKHTLTYPETIKSMNLSFKFPKNQIENL